MPNVDVPDLGVVAFPDDMPETEINTAIENEYKKIGVKKSLEAVNLPFSIMTNPAVGEASQLGRQVDRRNRLTQAPPESGDLRAAADYLRFGPGALGGGDVSKKPFVSEGGTRLDFPKEQIGLPSVTPPKEAGTGEKIAAGVYNTAAGLVNFPLSLEGYASTLGAELLPPPVTKAIFAGLLTKGAAEQAGKASVTHDPQDITEAALTAVPVPFLARPGFARPAPVAPLQGPPAPGELLRMPPGARVPRGEPAPALETVDPVTASANALRMTREATGEDFAPTAKLRAPKPVVPVEGAEPTVPEMTPAREDLTGLALQIDQVRKANARTKEQIRELFPEMNRQQAADLRDKAWKEKEPINAPETRNEPGSVQPERPGDDESGTPPEAGAGSGVPPKTPVSPPEAPGAAQVPPVDTAKFKKLTPIVRFGDVQFSGETHADAINKAIKSGKLTDEQLEAIVTGNGKFERAFLADDGKTVLNREQAAAWFKDKTGKEPSKSGELHSADLQTEDLTGNAKPPGETVTLYRGDDGTGGAWFTGNAEKAASFGKEVRTVQVSKAEAEAAKEAAKKQGQGGDTYFLTRAQADKAKPVEAPKEKVINLDKPPGEKPPASAEPANNLPKPGTPEYEGLPMSAKSALGEHEINQRIIDTGMQPTGKKATKAQIAELVERQKQVLKNFEAAKSAPPAEPPAAAVAKVETQVEKVAATEGQRPAKEVKTELVQRLEAEIESAPTEFDAVSEAVKKKGAKVELNNEKFEAQKNDVFPSLPRTTIEIPGDGTFTIPRTKEALAEVLDRAKKISTSSGEPVKIRKSGIPKADRDWIEQQIAEQTAKQQSAPDKLQETLESAAQDALNRIRARESGTTFGSGPLHELPNIKDYAIYGAAKLLKYGVRSAEWTKDMLEAFGPRIKAHLDKIFEASKNYLARYQAEQGSPGKPTSVQEIIAAATGAKPLEASNVTQAIDALKSGLQTARALKEHFTGQPKIPRADVKLADDFLEADANRIRESLNELVKNLLPPDERGRFLTAIANATKRSPILTGDPESMYRRAAQVAARIEDRAVDVRKNDAIASLKETVARALQSPTVDIGYKRRIMQAMSEVSLTKPTQATLDALQRTKDYLDRQEALGHDVSMPREILDSLSLLTKVPLRDMPAEAVFALAQKIAQLEELGRLKVAARQEVWDAEKSRKVSELSDEGTTPLEQRPQLAHQPGESDSFSQRLGNVLNRMINAASFIDKALLPIDALFDFMGDGKGDYRGWLFRHIRGPLDLGFNEHLVLRDELAKPIEALIKKHNLGQREAERVNVYGLAHMPGGVERMVEQGILPETIEQVLKTISEPEREVYLAMRRAFDSQLPDLQKLMHQLYNIEVKPVENYWPMPRDWEKQRVYQEAPPAKEPAFGEPMHYDELAGWKDMFADFFPGKTTATEKGMTIERKPEAKTPIKMNAFDVFWQHINDVTYLLKTQRDLKMIGEMVRTPQFEAKYGKAGQGLTLDFLDTFARQGRLGGLRRIPWLDTLRKNTSAGIIGFRVASQFVHASNVSFSIQRAGFDNYSAAVAELAAKPEAREWMERNFREALARGGGEPAIAEASGKAPVGLTNYRKVARSSMAIARAIDKYNAEATMLGVYFKEVKRLGGDPGNYLNEPINRDAQARAMVLARRAVASPLPKDVPMALSRGTLTGGNISMSRSLLQFQNIFLDQWSNIRHDLWRSGIMERDPKKAAVLFLTVAGTVAMETMIREGAAAGWQQVTGHKKKEESIPSKVIRETARRFPGGGQLTNLILHGETGIPSLDMIVETGSAAKNLVATKNPRTAQRAAVKLLGGIGQLAGIPGSGEISQQTLNAMRSAKE